MEEKLLHAEEEEVEKNLPFLTRENLNSSPASLPFDAAKLALLQGSSGLCKDEKLKSQKNIEQLFNEGKSVFYSGFTLVYLAQPLAAAYPAQVGFSVPKRFYKHAVDRNRIKRLMREAYRKNKWPLYEKLLTQQQQMSLLFVYKGKTIPSQTTVNQAVVTCIQKMIKLYE